MIDNRGTVPKALGARAAVALVALISLLVLAGCSDSDDGGIATAGGTTGSSEDDGESDQPTEEDAEEQMLAFTKCLREHGVDVDDSGGGIQIKGTPGDSDVIDEAMKACEDLRPQMGRDGESPEIPEEMKAKFLALAQCMRDEGYDFPDPKFDGGGVRIGGPGSDLDPEDPEVQEAMERCHEEVGLDMPEMRQGTSS
jgi:hypothetical protein